MMCCDLCTGPEPARVIPVGGFVMTLPSGEKMTNEAGYWAACNDCLTDFEGRHFEVIARRAAAYAERRMGRALPVELLRGMITETRALMAAVYVHCTGEA